MRLVDSHFLPGSEIGARASGDARGPAGGAYAGRAVHVWLVAFSAMLALMTVSSLVHAAPSGELGLVEVSEDTEESVSTSTSDDFHPSPIWRSAQSDGYELVAQRGNGTGTATYSGGVSAQNPPGFYVPVRPEYEGRVFTIRATAFTSNHDLLSLSLGYNRHPVFDLEFGVWANPLWCSDLIDRCSPGSNITAWGAFLQYGISRQLADQRGIRRRPWSFEVPFHLEFRYLNGDDISTLLWGVHVGIEFIRWIRPGTGLAIKLTAGSPFVDMISWNLQSLSVNLRGSIGITF